MRRSREVENEVVRWGAGCLVATAALTGILILVLLVAIAFQPPPWVQVLLGLGLVGGGGLLAWLVANAVGQARENEQQKRIADSG